MAAFPRDAIERWVKTPLAPGAVVISDGLGCFSGLIGAGCVRAPTVGRDRKPRDLPEFSWVNTVLGNLKTILAGTHHAFNVRNCAAHCVAAFASGRGKVVVFA